ncbi:MAG: hypothetical protein MUQ65_00235, partial [Armatimonadetes bacterium]|nr:hypothetical protein [Armatimonadota bacterium]
YRALTQGAIAPPLPFAFAETLASPAWRKAEESRSSWREAAPELSKPGKTCCRRRRALSAA